MGLADSIRIMLGKLTPAEIEEREAAAQARHVRKMAQIEAETARLDAQIAKNAAQNAKNAARDAARQREADLYHQRLSRAAGVATLELHCHRDTWKWVVEWMDVGRTYHSWWPQAHADRITAESEHMIVVRLSGPQAAEVLTRLALTADVPGASMFSSRASITEKSISRRLYDAIGRVLDQITPDGGSKQPVPPVVLDDRPGDEGS